MGKMLDYIKNRQVGIVVIHENNTPPLHWRLGRVIETMKGSNGNIRVIMVKTLTKTLKKSITKVCSLPNID